MNSSRAEEEMVGHAANQGVRSLLTMVIVCVGIVVLFVAASLFGLMGGLAAIVLTLLVILACWLPTTWTWYRRRHTSR